MHEIDRKRAEIIARDGWAVILVDAETPFGYTSGVFQTFGMPELFIAGLRFEDTQALCNKYGEAIRAGESLANGQVIEDWLVVGRLRLVEVEDQWKPVFLGKTFDDLGETLFPCLQAVWSTADGAFPWEDAWPARLQGKQFLLGLPEGVDPDQ